MRIQSAVSNRIKRVVSRYYRMKIGSELPKHLRTEPCILCGSSEFTPVWNKDRYGLPIQTQECAKCNLLQVNPRPTPDYIETFYSTRRYTGLYRGVLWTKDPTYNKAQKKAVVNMAFFASLARNPDIKVNWDHARVLDFGASAGGFISHYKKRFPKSFVAGYEPGAHISTIGQEGIDAAYSQFSQLEDVPPFDIITSWHVIEHLHNPIDILKKLRVHIKPGGILIFEVPNRSKYSGIRNIHLGHLYHFDQISVEKLCELSGFNLILSTDEHVQDPAFGRKFVAAPR